MLTDCHFHLNRIRKEELPRVLQRAKDFGVGQIIAVGINLESSREAVRLANFYEGVYAGVGIHPGRAHEVSEGDYDKLGDLVTANEKIVCFGEIGLDYGQEYGSGTPSRPTPPASPEVQKDVLRKQIRLSRELKMPLNVHLRRSSSRDVLDILKEEKANEVGGILHQFMANEKVAQEMFDLGMDIGVSQFICDSRADRLRSVVKNLPFEKIVLETDGPGAQYPPETDLPSEPIHTRLVAEKLAELKGLSLVNIESITSANTKRIFGI
ncbi:TatD family hydrolase [Chloroflexota bacterium]